MTTVHLQTIEAGGGTVRGVRLALGVAAILALVAWSALDGGSSVDRSRPQANEQLASPEAWPVYDGRGKWRGY